MSSGRKQSPWRKLTPGEWARQDQHLAEARDLGAVDPRTALFTTAYVEGQQCCWCSCPDDSTSRRFPCPGYIPCLGYVCAGCPADARHQVIAYHGTPDEQSYPVCSGHYKAALRWLLRAFELTDVDREYLARPVLDTERGDR